MKLHSDFLSRRPLSSSQLLRGRHACRRTVFQIPQLASYFPPAGKSREQRYSNRKILPYSQKQLYNIISDVDNYHRFVPYCTESKVLTKWRVNSPDVDEKAVKQEARLTVGFLAFKESYVSEVTCRPFHSVEAVASSGTPLFRKLVTTWRFQPASPLSPRAVQTGVPKDTASFSLETAACEDLPSPATPDQPSSSRGPTLLAIDLVFAFANPVYAAASAAFFKDISTMMVEAFEKRCLEVYGPGTK